MLQEYSTPLTHQLTFDDESLYDFFALRATNRPDDRVAAYKEEGNQEWTYVTATDMLADIRAAAKGMMALGVRKGDSVAIYSTTRYQWGVIDFACAAVGAISIPIYQTDSAAQVNAIVEATHPKLAFGDGRQRCIALEQARQSSPSLSYVFDFLDQGLESLSAWGESVADEELDAAIDAVSTDDVDTIVFTSGSTGAPKGAQITHRNFIHTARCGWDVLPSATYQPSRIFLFLPLAHCFARYAEYLALGANGCVAYVPDTTHLLADIRSFKPTYLLAVPRVYEKIYNAASRKAGTGAKGRTFARATEHFIRWDTDNQEHRHHSIKEQLAHRFYEKTVDSAVSDALGGSVHWLMCGGAPMNLDLAHFYNGLDSIRFIEGYGMTETAAPCCVNFEYSTKIGTVGHPGPGISFRIASDGELLIKGDGVFPGYYENPEATRETFDSDGWLKTGDLATIDDSGFVSITGRKKDIIITAGGKNVTPSTAEEAIGTCPIVSNAVLVGDKKPFVAALITLEPAMLAKWLDQQGLPQLTLSQAAGNDAVRSFVQQYIDKANLGVSRAESVRKFVILDHDFSVDEGTLTPSLKIVRHAINERYADVINNDIYAPKTTDKLQPAPTRVLKSKTSEGLEKAHDEIAKAQANVSAKLKSTLAARRGTEEAGDADGGSEDTDEPREE